MDIEEAMEQISRVILDREWIQLLNPYTWKALINDSPRKPITFNGGLGA
jgi:hypothetical protein